MVLCVFKEMNLNLFQDVWEFQVPDQIIVLEWKTFLPMRLLHLSHYLLHLLHQHNNHNHNGEILQYYLNQLIDLFLCVRVTVIGIPM